MLRKKNIPNEGFLDFFTVRQRVVNTKMCYDFFFALINRQVASGDWLLRIRNTFLCPRLFVTRYVSL